MGHFPCRSARAGVAHDLRPTAGAWHVGRRSARATGGSEVIAIKA